VGFLRRVKGKNNEWSNSGATGSRSLQTITLTRLRTQNTDSDVLCSTRPSDFHPTCSCQTFFVLRRQGQITVFMFLSVLMGFSETFHAEGIAIASAIRTGLLRMTPKAPS